MTNDTEQFIKRIKEIHMTPDEMQAVRRNLEAYARAHPVRSRWSGMLLRHAFSYTFAAIVLLTGSTGVLAQRSLPGDALYPLKLAVNDRVAVAISGDEDARLEKELEQIERDLFDEEHIAITDLAPDAEDEDMIEDDLPFDEALDDELQALERELEDALNDEPSL